jgi:hypothetical protein
MLLSLFQELGPADLRQELNEAQQWVRRNYTVSARYYLSVTILVSTIHLP